jgi:outer membrane protein assembly factor BamB
MSKPTSVLAGLAVALLLGATSATAADWPMFGRDHTRNAASLEKNPPTSWQAEERSENGSVRQPAWNIKWEAALGSNNFSTPVVSGGLVWIGTNNAKPRDPKVTEDAAVLMCFRERDGKFLWQYVSPRLKDKYQDWDHAGINCSPLVIGDRLWFTTNRCEVLSLDIGPLRMGKGEPRQLWKLDMRKELGVWPRGQLMGPGYTCSIATPYQGQIYVTTGNGVGEDHSTVPAPQAPSLVCLDKDTGKVLWSDNSPGKNILDVQWSSPLVIEVNGRGQVVAGQGDGWVRSFDALTGKLIWEFDGNPKRAKWVYSGRGTRNSIVGTPVAYGGRVYVCMGREVEQGEGPGHLWCIDPGKRGDVSPELVVDAEGKVIPHRRNQAATEKDRVIPNPNSAALWHYEKHDQNGDGRIDFEEEFHRSTGTVVIKDDLLYLGDHSGLFHCVDAKTGQAHWTYDTLSSCYGSALVVDDKVYLADDEGDVAVFNHSADKNKAMKKVGAEYQPIEENRMAVSIGSSPVFANGVLYVATRWKLYAIQEGGADGTERAPGQWHQWRGPGRSNVSRETGLLGEWPKAGPPLAWRADGLGEGAPSVAVSGGRVFVLGYRDDEEFLTALQAKDGKRLWSQPIGPAAKEWSSMRYLSQRTPTVDDEQVYAFTARGELICLNVATGDERWRKDYVKDFAGKPGLWGYCDFPLVDDDKLICTPGAKEATVVALRKDTGKVIWQCAVPGAKRGTYGGIVAANIAGVRQFVHQLEHSVVGIGASDGKLLWQFSPFGDERGNVHTPIIHGDHVFVSCGWGVGCALLKIVRAKDGFRVETLYRSKTLLDSWLGSSVLLGDHVHTAEGLCIELKSGTLARRLGMRRGTLVGAEGALYHRSGDNVLTLTQVTAKGEYVAKGDFRAPLHSTEPAWTFPVIAGRRLYLRNHDVLLCYDLAEKSPRRRGPDAIFVPTPQDVVEKMLELAEVKKEDFVADLGCGDGRIVVTAAKKYGCRAVGRDLDPECVRMSKAAVTEAGVGGLVRIEHADLFDMDLSEASVATLYLGSKLNVKLIPQLEKMKPGSRIVSHAFDIPGIKPDKVISYVSREDEIARTLYLWTIPLKKETKREK